VALVGIRRGPAFADLGRDDPADVGRAQPPPLGFAAAQAGPGAGDVRAARRQ
jgi:hypothetical protein